MAAINNPTPPSSTASQLQNSRVTTVIACPGVRPMGRGDETPFAGTTANENFGVDHAGWRRRIFANIVTVAFVGVLLVAGVWIVTEFARLQMIEKCFEAGRTNCLPLDLTRRQK